MHKRVNLGTIVRLLHHDLKVMGSKHGNNISIHEVRLHIFDPPQTLKWQKSHALGCPFLVLYMYIPSLHGYNFQFEILGNTDVQFLPLQQAKPRWYMWIQYRCPHCNMFCLIKKMSQDTNQWFRSKCCNGNLGGFI